MTSTDSKPSVGIHPLRQATARLLFLAVVLAGAAMFGSRLTVDCNRAADRVDCQVIRGVELPVGEHAWVPFWRQGVTNVREVRVERQSTSRSGGATSQSHDVLIWIGDRRLEAGWTGAWSPVRSFLQSTTRTELTLHQPVDMRAKLISNGLLLLAALAMLDSLVILVVGNQRLRAWLGPPPDPDAPLPTTGLAKVGPVLLVLGVVGLVLFFAFGYRYVGPLAEHKVAALHAAAAEGDADALDRVLASGVAVDALNQGRTALYLGARHPALLARLLASGADPNTVGTSGETPLHSAASYNREGGVEKLLALGAYPDAMDDSGWTPLRRAAAASNAEAVTALLAAGADPRRQGPHGWTPLHSAASASHAGIVATLLAAGADPAVRNEGGHVPGDLAGDAEIKDVIRDAELGRDVDEGTTRTDQVGI